MKLAPEMQTESSLTRARTEKLDEAPRGAVNFKKIIFKNSSWLFVGEVLSRLFLLFLFVYAARILGPTDFGVFNFALAFASLFLVFSNLGIVEIVTRELSKNTSGDNYSKVITLKLLLSVLAYVIIFFSSFFVIQDAQIIVRILGVYILAHSFMNIIYSYYRARGKMEYEAGIKITEALLIALIGLWVLFNIPSVSNLSFVFLISALLVSIFALFYSFIAGIFRFSFDVIFWKNFLRISMPLGLAYAFGLVYVNIDSVMMGFWGQITEVGWYNAAYKIAGVLVVPSSLLGTVFLPVLSKFYKESETNLKEMFKFYIKLSVIASVLVVFLGLISAHYVIDILYGSAFLQSTLALQILVIMVGLNYIHTPFFMVMIVLNLQKRLLWISLLGAVVNIILNFMLIPTYSLYGAAVATTVSYLVILIAIVVFYIQSRKEKSHAF